MTSKNYSFVFKSILLFSLLQGILMTAYSQEFRYKDCLAKWSGEQLTIENSFLRRTWQIKNGLPVNVSLKDLSTGKEKLSGPSNGSSPAPEFLNNQKFRSVKISADTVKPVVVEMTSLRVTVTTEYPTYTLHFFYKIYPQTSAITSWIKIEQKTSLASQVSAGIAPENGGDETKGRSQTKQTDVNENFVLSHVHHQLRVVTLYGQTDWSDNLVQVQSFLLTNPMSYNFQSNLFILEDQLSGDGLIFLKEAPLPQERPVKSEFDLQINAKNFLFTGLGAGTDSVRESYPFTVVLYQHGEKGSIKALQQYQRRFRNYDADRDELIWHSIWGDRNRDGRMSDKFLYKEMELDNDLGINHLYFIDGWQKGASSNSVNANKGGLWENQWSQKDYWAPNNERFPKGFDSLIAKAHRNGFKIGMWYNPDRTNDYANWEKDVAVLLNFYRLYGATYFKFDGVNFNTKLGESNLVKAMHRIVQETNGKAAIEIDITAGIRTGYFSAMQYGALFIENRYTDFRRYYPHTTLRNLWQLSHYVDARRMRFEFLNNERNIKLYPNDPLAPALYSADYLFAITMFAKPMAWLETSGLSEQYKTNLKKIIPVYKRHWSAIHQGTIYPIGEEPTGFSWSGFQSEVSDQTGYVVMFRDVNDAMRFTCPLSLDKGSYRFELLSGDGKSFSTSVGSSGSVTFSLPQKRQYTFYKYKRVSK